MLAWIPCIVTSCLIGVFAEDPSDPFHIVSQQPPKESNESPGIFEEEIWRPEEGKKGLKNNEQLWPRATVIYKVDDSLGCPGSWRCQLVMQAMALYEELTCVRFKEWTGEKDFLMIRRIPSEGCNTTLGKRDGETWMTLADGCFNLGTVLHEIGHTLTLWDEHNRPDRDKWISINLDNVVPDARQYFAKVHLSRINLVREPFDFDSIMMYGPYSFSKDVHSPSIKTKTGAPLMHISDKGNLSAGDIRKITKLYRCIGENQKPKFPSDVICSFDEDACGFKGVNQRHWSWTPKFYGQKSISGDRDYLDRDGWLHSDFETAQNSEVHLWTINFHALSPLDQPRRSSGLGCVSFAYLISSDKGAFLKLYLMYLGSALDLEYFSENTWKIWEKTDLNFRWMRVYIPIYVTKPFMLMFKSKFAEGTTEGSIQLDDFWMKYSPCPKPKETVTVVDSEDPYRTTPPNQALGAAVRRLSTFYQRYLSKRSFRSFSNGERKRTPTPERTLSIQKRPGL